MSTETSEDLVKRLMSEIRAHGKAMEASSSSIPYDRRDSGPGREEVRDVDIYDNNATFVIRKPVDRKSDHTFLTVNSSGLVNGKVSSSTYQNNNQQQSTPILSTFLSRPSTKPISTSLNSTIKYNSPLTTTTIPSTTTTSAHLISRNYVPPQIIATTSTGTIGLTSQLTTVANGGVNLIKGESDVSCYSSISSTAAGAADQLVRGCRTNQIKSSAGKLMCDPADEPHCPSCGVHLGNSNSDQISSEPYMMPNGVTIKSNGRSQVNGERVHNSHCHSVVKCDLIGSHSSPDDPPRYSPCRLYNGQANGYHYYHHSHHHHTPQDRVGSKVILSLPKVPFNGKSNNQGGLINGKKSKTQKPLKYIKKVQRCPGCAGKCYIEPVQRSVNHLSLSNGDNQLFTLYCPSCSKTGLTRVKGTAENGNYLMNGTIDKHLTYYSALPRLWDTEMWHRKRKRASIKKNEKILIVFTSIVSLVIFMTLTYLGVTTFQKITELPKLG